MNQRSVILKRLTLQEIISRSILLWERPSFLHRLHCLAGRKSAFEELVRRLKLPTFAEGNTFEYQSSYVLRGLAGLEIDIEKK